MGQVLNSVDRCNVGVNAHQSLSDAGMVTKGRPLVTVSRRSASLPATGWLLFPLCLSLQLLACQSLPTKTYEIRQEYAYIHNRRQAVVNGTETTDDLPAPPVAEIPPNLKGLA